MKRLDYTKVSVKLKKSEWRDEWFIYLEAYPVYETGNDKPKRVREYLRRSITTPIWDKRRSERAVAVRIKYKPKRDDNGVIQCKSKPQETDMGSYSLYVALSITRGSTCKADTTIPYRSYR